MTLTEQQLREAAERAGAKLAHIIRKLIPGDMNEAMFAKDFAFHIAAELQAAHLPDGRGSTDADLIRKYCKVVYWPKDGSYPIEHAPDANKIQFDEILRQIAEDHGQPAREAPRVALPSVVEEARAKHLTESIRRAEEWIRCYCDGYEDMRRILKALRASEERCRELEAKVQELRDLYEANHG